MRVAIYARYSTDKQKPVSIAVQNENCRAYLARQDPLDYRFVHHTQLDTLDHLRPDDLRQSAVILAAVLMQAADADEPLPRTPIPTAPAPPSAFERR